MAKKRLIAIVDDVPDTLKLFHDFLSKMKDISIFTFTDPLMAVEHFRMNKNEYVLVISDLRMPNLNGIELVKIIKDLNPLVRTILMTAFDVNDGIFEQYTKQNIINSFLQKPIAIKDLITELEIQLQIHQLQKQG